MHFGSIRVIKLMIVTIIKEMNIWPDMFVCEVATLMQVIRENHYKENAFNLSYLT